MTESGTAQENIAAVARLESEFLERRTEVERVADAIAAFAGSVWFVLIHFVWFAVWVLLNTGRIPAVEPFDPYPFTLLTLIVSCEAVLLSTFVLMKQNRMGKRADQRAHLNLQVDILAEREVTKALEMLRLLCDKAGLQHAAHEPEVEELSQTTAIDELAWELRQQLPQDQR